MNSTTRLAAALTVLAASVALVPAANAAVIVPATYVQGTLTALDVAQNTLAVDGKSYTIEAPANLDALSVGEDVKLTLVVANGKAHAIWVEQTNQDQPDTMDADTGLAD